MSTLCFGRYYFWKLFKEQKKKRTRDEQVNKLMIILRIVFNELSNAIYFWMCGFEWKAKNQMIVLKRKVKYNKKKQIRKRTRFFCRACVYAFFLILSDMLLNRFVFRKTAFSKWSVCEKKIYSANLVLIRWKSNDAKLV